jgi:nucleotide-binding universal stress UspA family protein
VINEAATLARTLDGRIVLFAVVQPPPVFNEYSAMLDITDLVAAGERNAVRKLEALESKLKARFIKAESAQATGNPISLILEEAAKQGADYIVMGSHGHTALYDLLVGSTTHGVLKRAKCPVVIVPATTAKPKRRKKAMTSAR